MFRDLEILGVSDCVRSFARKMHWVRSHLAGMQKLHYRHYQEGWFLDATETYCAAVHDLLDGLSHHPLSSRGLTAFRDFLAAYAGSEEFDSLAAEAGRIRGELKSLRYAIQIMGSRVTVSEFEGEPDYSREIEDTFAKFKQGAVADHRVRFSDYLDMNHVQAQVLERVARLFPDVFADLSRYRESNSGFIDPTVANFDREILFYLAYLDYIEPLKKSGLPFCFPEVSETSKMINADDAFDIALAGSLGPKAADIVRNDVSLTDDERLLVVTGPNQGGKTTFARMFGQLHYLASLGVPVPGQNARLYLADHIFTHFEREEELANLRGKLEDELVRVHEILGRATNKSIVIMNESFTSTTLADALFIGIEILKQVTELGSLCVYVTFVDELASLNAATVSVVASVVPDAPDVRTFKLVRKRADGRAHALALAKKHGLTYEILKSRVAR